MISHGDELGRTQRGNNNVYCQDNELTWIDWELDDTQKALVEFTSSLITLRLSEPVLRRRKYFLGRAIRGGGVKDVAWIAPDGREMTDEAWNADFVKSLGLVLSGSAIEEVDERGEPIVGDTLLVLLNAHDEKVPFTLPSLDDPGPAAPEEPEDADNAPAEGSGAAEAKGEPHQWRRLLDTMASKSVGRSYRGGIRYPLQGRSVVVFKLTPPVRERRRFRAPHRAPAALLKA
jgi:glycogen operon protein